MKIADIEITPRESGPLLWIRIGALKVRLELTHEQARRFCIGLLGQERVETFAEVQAGPLQLPKGIREIDESVLNAREVKIG